MSKSDFYEDVAIAGRNTNYAEKFIRESQDESNNPTIGGEDYSDPSLQRQEGETQQEYNERVPVALQPVQPNPTKSYLGNDL